MIDQEPVYCLAGLIAAVFAIGVFRKSFDPFAPIWLFLCGYLQVYVVQAITCRDYALRVRGVELVTAANYRSLWALALFLMVYYSGLGKWLASRLPRPPSTWSTSAVLGLSPLLIAWGLVCAGLFAGKTDEVDQTPENALLLSFPMMMLVGGLLLIATGNRPEKRNPALLGSGLLIVFLYIMIWMIRGRRTPPLFGVLSTICVLYVSRLKRPSKLVLAATAFTGIMVVSLAIGFRNNLKYEQSLKGFIEYAGDFEAAQVLDALNMAEDEEGEQRLERLTRETWEYGGFLLMMDTVPEKSGYDYGASYLRLITTYIPRIIWRDKPLYGRDQWVAAWMAGSEFKRKDDFTGPAIGILGATQLNGGAIGTAIVFSILALGLRTGYEFFKRYESMPWVQVWWSLTYYNAWLMTVNDDPFVWFYYVYGHTVLPPMILLWLINRFGSQRAKEA